MAASIGLVLMILGGVFTSRNFSSRLAQASRTNVNVMNALQRVSQAKHKCTITWPGRNGVQPSVASFAVDDCSAKCRPSDNHYDEIFARSLKAVQVSKERCSCQTLSGRELLKFVGKCESSSTEAAEAQKVCFEHYKVLATNEWTTRPGRSTLQIVPHDELLTEQSVTYSCEEDVCHDDETACFSASLPSTWESRGEAEHRMLANAVAKVANADTANLSKDEKEIVGELSQDDIQQAGALAVSDFGADATPGFNQRLAAVMKYGADLLLDAEEDGETESALDEETQWEQSANEMFEMLERRSGESDGRPGTITLTVLKGHYAESLKSTGIRIDALLKLAGIKDEAHISRDEFKRFLNPDCAHDKALQEM